MLQTAKVIANDFLFRGRPYAVGDTVDLSNEQPDMIGRLLNAGCLAPVDEPESPATKRARAGVKKATQDLEKQERVLQDLDERRGKAQARAESLAGERKQQALLAIKGDTQAEARAAELRQALFAANQDIDDLAAAVQAQEDETEAARRALSDAEQGVRRAILQGLADQRVEVVKAIDSALADLARHVLEYRELGRRVDSALGQGSTQVTSTWRLESVIQAASGLGGYQDPALT